MHTARRRGPLSGALKGSRHETAIVVRQAVGRPAPGQDPWARRARSRWVDDVSVGTPGTGGLERFERFRLGCRRCSVGHSRKVQSSRRSMGVTICKARDRATGGRSKRSSEAYARDPVPLSVKVTGYESYADPLTGEPWEAEASRTVRGETIRRTPPNGSLAGRPATGRHGASAGRDTHRPQPRHGATAEKSPRTKVLRGSRDNAGPYPKRLPDGLAPTAGP